MPTVYQRSVGATGRDYSTVAAALAAISSIVGDDDLVVEDAQVDLQTYNDAVFTERVSVSSAIVQDSTRFVRIIAASGQGHNGTLDSGVHFEPSSGSGHIFTISSSHTRLERLELQQYSGAGTSDEAIRITSGVVGVRIEKCLLDRSGSATQQDGIYVGNWSVGSSSFPIVVRDCVFTRWNRAAIHMQSFDAFVTTSQWINIINCTFGNNSYGIGHALAAGGSTLRYRIVNCTIGDSPTNDYGATGSVNGAITTTDSTNNFDEQNQTPAVTVAVWTTSSTPGAGSWAIFNTFYSDLRLQDVAANALIDAGVGTSNALVSATDAVGNPRGVTTSTVGAFEIPSASEPPAILPALTPIGSDPATAAAVPAPFTGTPWDGPTLVTPAILPALTPIGSDPATLDAAVPALTQIGSDPGALAVVTPDLAPVGSGAATAAVVPTPFAGTETGAAAVAAVTPALAPVGSDPGVLAAVVPPLGATPWDGPTLGTPAILPALTPIGSDAATLAVATPALGNLTGSDPSTAAAVPAPFAGALWDGPTLISVATLPALTPVETDAATLAATAPALTSIGSDPGVLAAVPAPFAGTPWDGPDLTNAAILPALDPIASDPATLGAVPKAWDPVVIQAATLGVQIQALDPIALGSPRVAATTPNLTGIASGIAVAAAVAAMLTPIESDAATARVVTPGLVPQGWDGPDLRYGVETPELVPIGSDPATLVAMIPGFDPVAIGFATLPDVTEPEPPVEPLPPVVVIRTTPYGYVEPPAWLYEFIRRLQWRLPVRMSAWLTEPERRIVLNEIARVTRDWATWQILENRPGFEGPNVLVLRAKSRTTTEEREIAIDFGPEHRVDTVAFLTRLRIASVQLQL